MMTPDAAGTVGDLMTGDLIAVRPQDRAGRALDILLQSGLHALPIIDHDGAAAGIVTTADLIPADPDLLLAERFCGPPLTITEQAGLREAATLMRSERVHHLIVTAGDTVVGILSSLDLLALLENHAPDDDDAERTD